MKGAKARGEGGEEEEADQGHLEVLVSSERMGENNLNNGLSKKL